MQPQFLLPIYVDGTRQVTSRYLALMAAFNGMPRQP